MSGWVRAKGTERGRNLLPREEKGRGRRMERGGHAEDLHRGRLEKVGPL